ncbi:MAG: bifunctional ADP-dependent NAD(P)H-hydrate dehydratase/NAD(P)H-hydrate epimerase [Dehalococcoidia bacterium]|nr:bifunctional ADP-dependent NAD(P)H-hydrate dehydratase/NAD(P)H-hydrate epimerase [Dehalococcoidia bacterium]|tara:strand:+ start:12059 stop:13612 length:1554 start_codon:yes stop_codon:yes gene_type:complete
MKLVTVEEMRAMELAAVEAGVSEEQMMEEAGLAAAQEAWMLLGTLEGREIVVLAGPGNNGGDGLVAARHLHDWGAEVTVVAPRGRRDDSNLAELKSRQINVAQKDNFGEALPLLTTADLVLDGLLGVGKKRPLTEDEPIGEALVALENARSSAHPPKVLAIDLPTGLDADGGGVDSLTVAADLTVTFGLPKVGMYQAMGSGVVGRVQVVDIGIPQVAMEEALLELITSRWAHETLPERPEDGNKGTFGKVLVVGGCMRYRGAPALVAKAAYRTGAGLVTIACPEPIIASIAPITAETTWLPQEAAKDGGLQGKAALELRPEWASFDAGVVGPGLGHTGETRSLIWALLPDAAQDIAGRIVIDADALNGLAELEDGAERTPAGAVLTPHPGEMARLLKSTVEDVQANRVGAAREASRRYGCTVVLKGAHSVVANAEGQVRISPFANPLLATAGSGDVLAGMIAGYLGQGLDAFDAGTLSVYLHAAVGEALRLDYGESGLLAGELTARLPKVIREIVEA